MPDSPLETLQPSQSESCSLLGQLASDDIIEREGGDSSMSIGKIQAEVLKLHPSERARLAEALLLSLEELSDEENERLWAEKARRRHEDPVAGRASERIAADVFRDARGRLWAMIVERVIFHELAEQELLDIANYYENQSAGLGFDLGLGEKNSLRVEKETICTMCLLDKACTAWTLSPDARI